jgi:hypothetical protein
MPPSDCGELAELLLQAFTCLDVVEVRFLKIEMGRAEVQAALGSGVDGNCLLGRPSGGCGQSTGWTASLPDP